MRREKNGKGLVTFRKEDILDDNSSAKHGLMTKLVSLSRIHNRDKNPRIAILSKILEEILES